MILAASEGRTTRARDAGEAGSVTVEVADWDSHEGETLRAAQRAELVALYGGDVEPGPKPSASDVSVFLLARGADGEPLGCGALRHLGGQLAEIKRMFVPRSHRGRGISRLILSRLEDQAVARGWTVLRLETGPQQAEAIGLYTSAGYAPIPAFGHYVGSEHSLCFERRLG
jgi:putative acetyltransferase